MLDPGLERALVLLAGGEVRSATRSIRRLLTNEPDSGPLLQAAGIVDRQIGDMTGAARWCARASSAVPWVSAPHFTLAELLLAQRRFLAARRPARRALALDPANSAVLVVLADAEGDRDRPRAVAVLRRALAVDPQNTVVWANLGIWLRRIGLQAEALRHSQAALALSPAVGEILNNLAVISIKQRQLETAELWANRGLAASDLPEARWNRGIARVVAGRFTAAWNDMQARWRLPGGPRRRHGTERLWRGEAISGRRLLLSAEQGVGDTIQFSRYASLVSRLGARTILAVPPNLIRLMSTLDGPERVIADDQPADDFERHCSLMDLPAIFDTMLETIPAETPYLAADPEGIALWQRRLKTTRPLKVGLCWRGNPANHDDAERSLPLAALAALMQVPGVSYVAIRQDGEPLPAGWPIQDPAPAVGDMADAAAFLAALDLTITCDTSFAHLAGALALPVWVPLAYSPDWRWMLDRNDTPWYPTMRLFRQSRAGDWETVVREIAKSLQGVVAARISRPGAPRQ